MLLLWLIQKPTFSLVKIGSVENEILLLVVVVVNTVVVIVVIQVLVFGVMVIVDSRNLMVVGNGVQSLFHVKPNLCYVKLL